MELEIPVVRSPIGRLFNGRIGQRLINLNRVRKDDRKFICVVIDKLNYKIEDSFHCLYLQKVNWYLNWHIHASFNIFKCRVTADLTWHMSICNVRWFNIRELCLACWQSTFILILHETYALNCHIFTCNWRQLNSM